MTAADSARRPAVGEEVTRPESVVARPERQNAALGRWPHALSHEPLLRVSDVLALITTEFPTLTPSKLRFLDAQGLVSPVRTGGGYRHYSPADVERLRFVLRQQRDHYRPLTVIAAHLEALDRGEVAEGVIPHVVGDEAPPWLDARALAAAGGVAAFVVEVAVTEGLIAEGLPGRFSRAEVAVVAAAGQYLAGGGDSRALRALAQAAAREAERTRAAVAPLAAKGASEEATEVAATSAEAAIGVFGSVLRREIAKD